MNPLIVQPYVKVERAMIDFEQKSIVHHCELIIYTDRIKTDRHEFPMKEVFDMSYKQVGGGEGFLYLHTVFGVYSYMLKDHPAEVLKVYRSLQASI
ncbi:hypothetical protein [Paenibacillus aquistagni]|uniref:hypothetical protein n=1 Tax=Paenibacillus aquistagni TaxID=1852522 RepID=UPI00145AAD73|nr:hypothetical protein [Paenibacillus aquistagni]NMM51115.1 hypothetical protein [Paenibacillus aquistagni]